MPSALTKYSVVTVGLTVIVGPLLTKVPPQAPLYQFQIPAVPKEPPVIPRVVEALSQIVDKLAVAVMAGVDSVFTITVILKHVVVLHVPSALK